mmetsp:Transcript_13761/g.26881  ORF Transcript_13761/g.26881 Transcript_13761/m.26881 type:complete len:1170 (+) Transcript_13761:92-3601(+)
MANTSVYSPIISALVSLSYAAKYFSVGNLFEMVHAAQYGKNTLEITPRKGYIHSDIINPRRILRSRKLKKPPNSKYLDLLETMTRPESNGPSSQQNQLSFEDSTNVQPCPPSYDETEKSYSEGDQVSIDGMIFECNGQPFTKYCGQAEFQGITKEDDEVEREYWFYAWRLIGLCETDTSTSLMQSSFPICPPTYDASDVSYMDGDAVEVEGIMYECQSRPYSKYCGQSKFTPISEESDEVEMKYWLNAWKRIGPCILIQNEATETSSDIITGYTTPAPLASIESETPFVLSQTSYPTCPPPYNSSKISYAEGDLIEIEGYSYECREYPYSLYCGQSEFLPVTEEDDGIEREYWFNAWKRIGPCLDDNVSTGGQNEDMSGSSNESLQQQANQPSNQSVMNQLNRNSVAPSFRPTGSPTSSNIRTPTQKPSRKPTYHPTIDGSAPSAPWHSLSPSGLPMPKPTKKPTMKPSFLQSITPSKSSSNYPSTASSDEHFASPHSQTSTTPSIAPTGIPTHLPPRPTMSPSSARSSSFPNLSPTDPPTQTPTRVPTYEPSVAARNTPSISCSARLFHPNVGFSICTNSLDFPANWMDSALEEHYFYDSLDECCSAIFGVTKCPNGYVDECEPTSNGSLEEYSALTFSDQSTYNPTGRPVAVPLLEPTIGVSPASVSNRPTNEKSVIPPIQSSIAPSKFPVISPTIHLSINSSDTPSSITFSKQPSISPIAYPTTTTSGPSVQNTVRESSEPSSTPPFASNAPSEINSYETSLKLLTTPSTLPTGKQSAQVLSDNPLEPSPTSSEEPTLVTSKETDLSPPSSSPTNIQSDFYVEQGFMDYSGTPSMTLFPTSSPPPSFHKVHIPLPVIGVTLKTSDEGAVDVSELAQIFSAFLREQLRLELPKKYNLDSVQSSFGLYSTSALTGGESKKVHLFIVNANATYSEKDIPTIEEIEAVIPKITNGEYLEYLLTLLWTARDPVARSSYHVDAYLLHQIEYQNPAESSQKSSDSDSTDVSEPILVLPLVVGTIVAVLFMALARNRLIKRGAKLREARDIREGKLENAKKESRGDKKESSKQNEKGSINTDTIEEYKQEEICETALENAHLEPHAVGKKKEKASELSGKEILISPANSADGVGCDSMITFDPFNNTDYDAIIKELKEGNPRDDESSILGCLCV